jgi:hypothetical protein
MKSVFSLLLASALTLSAGSPRAEGAHGPAFDKAVRMLHACAKAGMTRCLPELMDPVLVEFLGGVSRISEMMEKGDQSSQQQGVTPEFNRMSLRVTSPIVQIGNAHYATLELKLPVTNGSRRVLAIDTVLAVSRDEGRRWHFVRATSRHTGYGALLSSRMGEDGTDRREIRPDSLSGVGFLGSTTRR